MVIYLPPSWQMSEENRYRSLSEISFSNFKEKPWPCFTKPYDNELLTSWLTRIARNHLVRFYSFCSSNFQGIEFWNRDLDQRQPEDFLNMIQQRCVLNELDLQSMLLDSYATKLFLKLKESRPFWITPLNFYWQNRKHIYGLMVCPSCLKCDGISPYYRKNWRIASTTICSVCQTELIDACPQCNSSINFLLAERGNKFKAPIFPISSCWRCLYNLSEVEAIKASPQMIVTQHVIDRYITAGHAQERGLQYSFLFFDVLKKILSLLNKSRVNSLIRLQEIICAATGTQFQLPLDNKLHPFNTLRVERRKNLIQQAFWLLDDWPDRFRSVISVSGLRSKYFLDDFKDAPYWFRKEIEENIKLKYFRWRDVHPEYSYSSFREFAQWQVSKKKKKMTIKIEYYCLMRSVIWKHVVSLTRNTCSQIKKS